MYFDSICLTRVSFLILKYFTLQFQAYPQYVEVRAQLLRVSFHSFTVWVGGVEIQLSGLEAGTVNH